MNKILLILLIVLALFIVYKIVTKYRKPKDDIIKIISGRNGGGKSCTCTYDVLRDYRNSVRYWRNVNNPSFIRRVLTLDYIKYFKRKRMAKESYGLQKPELYSNYPILISKGVYSKNITNDIMLLNESIPLGSVVIIDEFSAWINQFQYNQKFSESLNDHIQKWRHYHGDNSRLYCIDQSSDNIPIQVKRRCNRVLYCERIKHYLGFIHVLNYKYISTVEDIKTIEINSTRNLENENKEDTDDKTSKRIMFFIKKRYDSRAYSNRYTFVNSAVESHNAKYIDSPLKVNEVIDTPKERGTILNEKIKQIQNNIIDNNN